MAGTYTTKGSNIAGKVSGLLRSSNKAKVEPTKKAAAEKASAVKHERAKELIKTKASETRRTVTHRGKIAVKTVAQKAAVKTNKKGVK